MSAENDALKQRGQSKTADAAALTSTSDASGIGDASNVIDTANAAVKGEKSAKQTTDYASHWHKQDTIWTFSLFGTAVGAGVLFLPIKAGSAGILSLLFMVVLAFPLTYFAHRALCRFVLTAKHPGDDITDVVEQQFGFGFGMVFTIIYFVQIFTIILVYAVSITNTTESFIVNQLHMTAPPRWLLSGLLIGVLVCIVTCGTDVVTKVTSAMTYPVIAVLVLFALYLIPHWNTSILTSYPKTAGGAFDWGTLIQDLWLLVPVTIFGFDHSAIISSFCVNLREGYGLEQSDHKMMSILKRAEPLMVFVVLFFVLSCDLALTPGDLVKAKAQNVSILSYIANMLNSPVIAWIASLTAFVSIFKAFLGHYLGVEEGLGGIIRKIGEKKHRIIERRPLHIFVAIFMFVTCWLVAWANLSVINMIETMVGPIIAFILLLLPMYAIHKVPSLKKYSGKISNVFIVVIGVISVSAIFYNIVELF
ncbi:hypothetical protein OZX57_02560 [Bifidobacterium sp. ESL0682]|uniref:amino acid permease n=1 Tax=Bifidobacterium sp. ESL0682 TaxID=2983212 RepID=UPI0023F921CF|nr:hypothetical protein [Bifidobacterium sp. ESL0682]WEV42366.1 hypothetical protein OZX57_02560 [Bifidobacterium sp. ESL0682]